MAANPTFQSTGGANPAVQDDPTKKKALNLPYLDPNNPTAIAPVTNTAVIGNPMNLQQPQIQQVNPMAPQQQPQPQQVQQPQSQNDQLRGQAMSTLLTRANQPQQSTPIQSLVNQKTEGLLQDPNQGFNVNSYKQAQLSNYDKNEAQLFEALRQQFADSADSGVFRKDALQNRLDSLANRRTLESNIDYENRDYNQNSMLKALAEGRATEQQNQQIQNTPIDNLVKALQAGEGEAQRSADVETREDIQGYQTGERLDEQNYKSYQADLDRQLQVATQNKDIAAQERITQQKAMIDLNYLAQTQGFAAAQSDLDRQLQEATQNRDIAAQERLTALKADFDKQQLERQQTFEAQQSSIDRQLQLAIQNNDITAQEKLTQLKSDLELKHLVQTQGFEGAQNQLGRDLQLAIQSNDIVAQEKLTKLKAGLDMQQLIQVQGFDGAQNQLNRDLQTSLQSNDINATRENLFKQLEMDKYKADQGVELTREQNALNRALDVTLATMDSDTQKAVVSLRGKIEEGLMVKEQDWKSIESDLDRKQQELLQSNDISAAINIENLKGEIQSAYQERQQKFDNSQRDLSQVYNTSERLNIQSYEENMKYLDSKLLDQRAQGDATIAKELKTYDSQITEAQAKNDFGRVQELEYLRSDLEAQATKQAFSNTKEAMGLQAQIDEAAASNDQDRVLQLQYLKAAQEEKFAQNRNWENLAIEQQKFSFEWRMQNNSLDHDKMMTKLQSELDEAKAQKDLGRQEKLMTMQAGLDTNKMREQYGYETAMTNLRAKIDQAAAAKDFEYATILKKQELDTMVSESAKDRAIQQGEFALKQDGQKFAQYEAMKAAGDPEGAAKYLKAELAKQGISYNPVDAMEQAKKAVSADFAIAKEQYKLTHNGSVEGFNKFYNESVYGEKGTEGYIKDIVNGVYTAQEIKSDPKKLEVAKQSAANWDGGTYTDKKGANSTRFQSLPEMNIPFKYSNGKYYIRTSDPKEVTVRFGKNYEQITVVNVATGEVETLSSI